MVERLSIARLGARGDGVADTPAGPLYVPYTLPGEIAEVDQWPGHADRRHLIKVDSASPDRIAPICPHFGTCGGCALQHLATARYRHWKRALVTEALAKAGLDAAVDDLIDAHGDGRRRAVFHARRGTHDVLEVGFAALKAHRVVAIDRCPILAPGLDGAIETAWAIAEALAGTRKPLDIQVTATDAGLDVDVRGSGPLTAARAGDLAAIADRRRLARLTRHGEMVAQRTKPMLRIGRAQLVLPPGAFLQATAAGEAILARLVEAHCAGARTVADLFCGVGPFALRLAESARITAADNDAGRNRCLAARRDRGARPQADRGAGARPLSATVRAGRTQALRCRRVRSAAAGRRGAGAGARGVAGATVVAVSCNPATFARDARILIDGGYRLERVTPVDQFLYSAHVELVACFQRSGEGRRRTDR